MIFGDFGVCSGIDPAVFGLLEEVGEDQLDHFACHLDASGNPVGFQWDRGFLGVVEVEESAEAEVLVIAEVPGLHGVVVDVELVEMH